MGHERDGRWHLRKKEKRSSRGRSSVEKLLAQAPRHGRHFAALITATAEETCGCEGNPLAFWASFNKAWIELVHSLSLAWEMLHHKQRGDNWSHACGYYHTCTILFWTFLPRIVWDFLFTVTFRRSFTHALPHTGTRTAVERGQIAVAEDTWWNHQSHEPPSGQIRFVLVWAECSASWAKTGPRWLAGARGMPGLSTTSGGISILRQMDGRMMIRTRLWLCKAHWEASSTGDGFLPSSVHPTAKWETAGGMEGALFKPHLFSANSSSEGRLASCLNILDGRVMAPDDTSDLGQLWEWRKTPPAQSWEAESFTWTLKYSY